MKHISPTFMYNHTNVSEADNIYKNLPQMSFHLYFLLLLLHSGAPPMILLTAGALTDPRLPATASNVCTTDARLGGVDRVPPPKQKILATPVLRVFCVKRSAVAPAKLTSHFHHSAFIRKTWPRGKLLKKSWGTLIQYGTRIKCIPEQH